MVISFSYSRSVRSYDSGIDRDTLAAILKEAQQAPSWKNQQTSRCYAVLTPETLEELREAALPSFNRNSSAKAALVIPGFLKKIRPEPDALQFFVCHDLFLLTRPYGPRYICMIYGTHHSIFFCFWKKVLTHLFMFDKIYLYQTHRRHFDEL